MGRSIASRGEPKVSKGRAESPLVRPQAHTPRPRWGLTRRLRRGLGLAVPWGVHTFLSVAKEKCAKESQRHGDYGKKASIAHFPSAAYRRSAPPQLAVGRLTPCGLGSFNVVRKFCGVDKRTGFLFTGDGGHTPPLQVGMLRCGLEIFAVQKASVKSKSRWPF